MTVIHIEKDWKVTNHREGNGQILKDAASGFVKIMGVDICITEVRDRILVTLVADFSSEKHPAKSMRSIINRAIELRSAMDTLFGPDNIAGPTTEELAEELAHTE